MRWVRLGMRPKSASSNGKPASVSLVGRVIQLVLLAIVVARRLNCDGGAQAAAGLTHSNYFVKITRPSKIVHIT